MRRLLTTVVAGTMLAGPLAATPAQAAPNPPAFAAARWLDDQLVDGLTSTSGFADHGLSLDIFFTLKALDTRPAAAASVITAMQTQGSDYVTGFDPADKYAGAYGKLATAVQLAGEDATSFDGLNLVTDLEGLVVKTPGNELGRAKDASQYGEFSNEIGQSFVVRALEAAGSEWADEATAFLVKQQCAAGFFRTFLESADFSCNAGTAAESQPDVDATSYGVQALKAVGGHQAEIDKAIAWLLSVQAADGSFSSLGVANSNSTALAAIVLADAGQVGAAGSAAAWLAERQVTPDLAEGTKLANDLGAVAYDDKALAAGKTSGVTDQWRRATGQAALGLNMLLPAKALTVTTPTGFVKAARKATVGATGLVAGERYIVTIDGVTAASGVVPPSGVVSTRVTVPAGTKDHTVTLTGSRAHRRGTAVLRGLDKKTLGLRLRSVVATGGKQSARVSKLAPGEKVTVYYKGKKVKSGLANSHGRFVASFKVGRADGRFTVKVKGEFADRKAKRIFQVR